MDEETPVTEDPTPILDSGEIPMANGADIQDPTPVHSQGYGPAEQADETRQAQQQAANDVPVDVNPNAVVARVQTAGLVEQQGTFTLMGKNFEANADRRNKIFDDIVHLRSLKAS